MKSVPNLISYLHKFFQNFSQSLAICFELFSFGVILNSEIDDSGPHLSGTASRAGPARQRAAAAWRPRAAHLPGAVGTARRASRQHASRAPPPLRRLTHAVARPDSSPRPRRPPRARRRRPDRSPRSRRRPDRRSPKPPTPGSVAVSRRLPVAITPHRRLHAIEPPFPAVSRAPAPCHRRLAEQHRAAAVARSRRAAHVGRQGHGPRMQAAPALCIWVERGFGPVTPG
jgi:hypothetical protein